jgi:galactonate dehydratase
MRITDIATLAVDAGDRDWVFVRVDTDEPGLIGWGEASLGWYPNAVRGAVRDVRDLLVGEDPTDVERRSRSMLRAPYFRGGMVASAASSGIEQALWDIKAKASGVPLVDLLGGPVRDRVRTYVNLGSELGGDPADPEAWRAAGRAARDDGFDGMKVYPVPPARPLEDAVFVSRTVELVTAVREAAGDDADVMVDLHGRTTPAVAIQLAHAIEPLRPWFLEEPCQPGDTEGLIQVARSTSIPIATGERLHEAAAFAELVDRRACAVIQPNACYCGVSELLRIAALADRANVAVAPHNPNGPIGSMVSVHVAFAVPNLLTLEQVRADVPWRDELVDAPIEIRDGWVDRPTRPGIGVDLLEEVAAAHPGGSPRPHLVHAPDGTLLDW